MPQRKSPKDVIGFQHRAFQREMPQHTIPEESLPKEVAHRLIEDELSLDNQPLLNLATFVTTAGDAEAEDLMTQAGRKNAIDMDEYPQVGKMQQRCVNMIARMYNAPLEEDEDATGTACVGSSEAIMLATLAMKWKWKERCKREGREPKNPNIVFGANVQVCWHKACKYFEVENREASVSPDSLVLTADRAKALIDENTIGVCPILGSTYNGEYEDVKSIHDMVVEINEKEGWDIPLHVDAASGGFVAPFLTPELEWDFRLPNVKSINASGHKFGLVYAGIGWVVFREQKDLHRDLVFHVNYLGGDQASFTLNFSKGSGTIVMQYYNFIRLGREGFVDIMLNCMENAAYLRKALLDTERFVIVDKGHLPLVAWALKEDEDRFTVFDIQDKLRNKGWIVPAYRCPEGAKSLAILRCVVKENFSRGLAKSLLEDIKIACDILSDRPRKEAKHEINTVDRQPEKEHGADREAPDDKKDKETSGRVRTAAARWSTLKCAAKLMRAAKNSELHMGNDATHRLTGRRTEAPC